MDLEYYVSQFSSNDPGEDRFSSRYHREFGSFFCVIDGHGGCFSCDLANTFILDFFLEGLQKLPKPLNSSAEIIQILNETFQRCDERILQEAVRIRNLNPEGRCPGRTGCCVALAAVIEGKLYVAHAGDCRVVICRSLEPPSPKAPPTPLLQDTHQESLLSSPRSSSPQKRTSPRQLSDSLSPSPSKRSRAAGTGGGGEGDSCAILKPKPKHFFMNRDFHLEAVIEKSKARKHLPVPSQENDKVPVEEGKTESGDNSNGNSGEDQQNPAGEGETQHKNKQHKKKKKHKKNLFTEADFDMPEFTGAFENMGISVHCITKDHCCDDKEERIALKLLCPTDPKPMKPSANDKKLFGKEAIKRFLLPLDLPPNSPLPVRWNSVGGSLAVTRALGDGYLKVPFLSEEPLKSHVPYISGLPYVSCRTITSGVDLFLLIASDGLWNYITLEEVALIFHQYRHTHRAKTVSLENFQANPVPSISEILLNQCLHNAALLAGTSLDCLLTMPSGPYKRNVIDDVTIVVVILPSPSSE